MPSHLTMGCALALACQSNDPVIVSSGISTVPVEVDLAPGQSIEVRNQLTVRWQDEDAFDDVVDGAMWLSVESVSGPSAQKSDDSGTRDSDAARAPEASVALVDDQGHGASDASVEIEGTAVLYLSYCLRDECDERPFTTVCDVHGLDSCVVHYVGFVTSTAADLQTMEWYFTVRVDRWGADLPPLAFEQTPY